MREVTQDSKSERKREGRQGKKKNQENGVHFTRCTADNSGMMDICKVAVWKPLLGLTGLKKIIPQPKGNTFSKLSKHSLQMAFSSSGKLAE